MRRVLLKLGTQAKRPKSALVNARTSSHRLKQRVATNSKREGVGEQEGMTMQVPRLPTMQAQVVLASLRSVVRVGHGIGSSASG